LKIISKVGILLVVLGFFMPVACDQNGFEMAENITKMERAFAAGSSNGVGIALYLVFIASLISGLLIIPLLMNKKLHIGIDWSCLILSIGCGIYAYSKLKDLIAMGQKLQIGGWFILIGWIVAFVSLGIASLKKEKIPPIENNQLNT
jgi:FtsH-binding integral membrane protein